jgi:TatD DNase family protein
MDRFDGDLDAVVARAGAAGVDGVIVVGSDLASSRAAVELARARQRMWATAGIHPHDARHANLEALEEIARLARRPEVVAVGETGLDFYRDLSPRIEQERAFRMHLSIARQVAKPVVIHDRDAHSDILRVLRSEGLPPAGGVMHCFSGDQAFAEECLAMGLLISIAGPVTFGNAVRLHEAARAVPMDRLLVETDCPYLTPHPYRGRRNEPAYVVEIARKVAELKGLPPMEVAARTTANAVRLFRLG